MVSAALALLTPLGHMVYGEEGPRQPHVLTIALEDQSINPVTARFVDRGLRQAESTGAQCLIVQLDTPGGLMESTRRIVKDFLQAEVPVVVYVAPRAPRRLGGRVHHPGCQRRRDGAGHQHRRCPPCFPARPGR